MKMVHIGIDLGTTYSCVSVIEDGKPVVVVSDDDKRTIPSVVAYCESRILVGRPALSCDTDPSNILYGTLDISVAEINNGKIRLKAVTSDYHLGGQDFDERIMKYVIEEFKKSNNYDMSQRPDLMRRLRRACRKTKESLSSQMESCNVKLDINGNTSVNVKISRSNFNQLCEDLFDKAMEMVDKALRTAQISAEQIGNVILVGGSTRIPKIQELLSHKFDQAKLRYNANPEEAVAHGAALIAGALEKGIEIPLINNTMSELVRNINNVQIGEDNSFNSSHKILFYRPDPPEWRRHVSVAYFKDKLYYLSGWEPETYQDTNRVDLLMGGIVIRYIDYQTMNRNGLKLESFQKDELISELHR
ncbi:hypothetical protein WR25_17124 [Diploscapter pachys]|uniref:Uncharacterized protein n=1 Tax=Diploscapter pachys TaxID=2018661 RepID=A0A2A2LL08_9BILA|nr:hypothetical protein WR25_17124 [Diploscapter pachys]